MPQTSPTKVRVESPTKVRVELGRHGHWEVALPDGHERVRCASLHEARRLALRRAAERAPCEVIVYDAYHRVLHRSSDGESSARRSAL
jgi:hypothetical protein